MGKWRLRGIGSLTELYLNTGLNCFCSAVLLLSGHLAKDGGKTGWVETSSEMMVQQRDGQSVTQATGLRGKAGRLQDLVAALGTGVITGGLRFGEGPLSGSATAFKSLQGSLWGEDIVLSCVAPGGTDSIKSDREATGNKLLGEEIDPHPRRSAEKLESWRGCRQHVPGGSGLGDLFQFPVHPRILALGVVLGPLPPCFSHSFSELPLLVHLGMFLINARPAGLRLGESLPRGISSAQPAVQRPLRVCGSATGACAGGDWFHRGLTFFFHFPICEMGSISLSSNMRK